MSLQLLSHIWQSTAVALGVLVIILAFRTIPARTRHGLGWMALIKFAIPFTIVAPFVLSAGRIEKWLTAKPPTHSVVVRSVVSTDSVAPTIVFSPTQSTTEWSTIAVTEPTHWPLSTWLEIVWLAGAMGVTSSWIFRAWLARRRVLAEAQPLPWALERELIWASRKLGLSRPPRALMVDRDVAPAVIGLLWQTVILPTGLERDLAPAELESVLLHELVHVQRRDSLLAAIQTFFVSILWFNPIVWLVGRRLYLESEKSCDERVLELTGDPDAYAGGILKCVRRALGLPIPVYPSVAGAPITARITAILAYGTQPQNPFLRRLAVAAALALTCFGGLAGTFASSEQTQSPKTSQPVDTNQKLPDGAPNPQFLQAPPAESGRVVINLKDTPVTYSVINRQFIDALGVTGIPDATRLAQLQAQQEALIQQRVAARQQSAPAAQQPTANAPGTSQAAPAGKLAGKYPVELQGSGVGATVTVDYVADYQGTVTTARVDTSSDSRFDKAAVEAVRNTKFKPAMANGTPVSAHDTIDVVFAADGQVSATQQAPSPAAGQTPAERLVSGTWQPGVTISAPSTSSAVRIIVAPDPSGNGTYFVRPVAPATQQQQQPQSTQQPQQQMQQLQPAPPAGAVPQRSGQITPGAAGAAAASAGTLRFRAIQTAANVPTSSQQKTTTELKKIEVQDFSNVVGSAAQKKAAEDEETALKASRRITAPATIVTAKPMLKDGTTSVIVSTAGTEYARLSPSGALELSEYVYPEDAATKRPTARLQGKPEYPPALRASGEGGVATVDFIVDTDGNVVAAWTTNFGYHAFDQSAVDAVIRWKFSPGEKNGKPAAIHLSTTIQFNIAR